MIDFNNVKSAEASTGNSNVLFDIPAGAYNVYVVKAEHVEDSAYYKLWLDVAEGPYKDFAAKAKEATGNDWSYKVLYASYGSEKMLAQFSRLLDVMEESNRKFKAAEWKKTQRAADLEGMMFGVVMDDNEYNGKIKTRPSYFKTYNIDDIDAGKYAKPKKIERPVETAAQDNQAAPLNDGLPF